MFRCEKEGLSSYRMRRVRRRKSSHGSLSHDSDTGMSSNEESISLNGSHVNIPSSMTQSHQSETLLNFFSKPIRNHDSEVELENACFKNEDFLRNLKLNNAIREIFFNRFVQIFSSYDHFVIQPDQDSGRILVHNFDKATFLSDQPDQNLPFLSRFLETQMFASLIDRKIATISGETDPNLFIFEQRIKILRTKYGESLVRTPSYEPCVTIRETEEVIVKRFQNPDFCVPLPRDMNSEEVYLPVQGQTFFPILSKKLLNRSPTPIRNRKLLKEMSCGEGLAKDSSLSSGGSDYQSLRSVFVPTETNSSPASIAQANWEFVKQLLQECKSKTKRMLVEKLGGEEAVALGHGELNLVGVEERTLVASLCDLLERIWTHGLHVKQKGKSPLWNFLINYEEAEACKDTTKPLDPQFLSPYLSARAMELNLNVSSHSLTKGNVTEDAPHTRHESRSRSRIMELPVLRPLPVSIGFDIRSIQGISEIKTEIGYARAWIRLSLEKKVLSKHLRSLLSDDELLRGFYKRTAFLRAEEEREQFLYHLLTLNAVDYFSFTNTYTNILLPYRVLIYPSRRYGTTANVWVTVSGRLGETGVIVVPENKFDFVFQHKNLGLLLSLRIGHDNSGVAPRLLVDSVIVRNEVTGLTTKFPCGRWLGRDVDDGSMERLLVGEPFENDEEEQTRLKTPPRLRSPSAPRRFNDARIAVTGIQKLLGEAVKRVMKYYSKADQDKGSLTVLLCGELGLVAALEQVFQFGFKSSRLFTRNFYIWDYFLRVMEFFEAELAEEFVNVNSLGEDEYFPEQLDTMRAYVELIQKVQSFAQGLGMDGKFQLFICLSAREHLLHRLPIQLSSCHVTVEMYDKISFLRDPQLLPDLVQALEPLDDFDISLEQSLTKGIE